MAVEVNEDTFDREVLQSEKITLVEFHIPSCARCMVLMSAAEGLERRYHRHLKFAKISFFNNKALFSRLKISGTPTFVVYQNSRESERFYGDRLDMGTLENYIQTLMNTRNDWL